MEPVPRRPKLPRPQHHTVRSSARAHVWATPADTDTMVTSGLLRDVSTGNWTYAGPAAGSTNYTITAVAGGPCV